MKTHSRLLCPHCGETIAHLNDYIDTHERTMFTCPSCDTDYPLAAMVVCTVRGKMARDIRYTPSEHARRWY